MPGASVLLSCRTRYIAFYRMEYKRGCLGDNTFKREINFKHDYALILKLKEKGGNRSILAGVPSALPALIKAYRIQEKAANAGFDWEKPADVWDKVKEEISEFSAEASGFESKDAVSEEQRKRMEQEMGDVIFSIINAARLYGIHPENALELTNRKFISRFNHMESAIKSKNKTFKDLSLDEMERLWQEAKSAE